MESFTGCGQRSNVLTSIVNCQSKHFFQQLFRRRAVCLFQIACQRVGSFLLIYSDFVVAVAAPLLFFSTLHHLFFFPPSPHISSSSCSWSCVVCKLPNTPSKVTFVFPHPVLHCVLSTTFFYFFSGLFHSTLLFRSKRQQLNNNSRTNTSGSATMQKRRQREE